MKNKLIIIFITASIITFLIYQTTYHKTLKITSISTLKQDENYNTYLSDKLINSNIDYKLNIDYSNPNIEIENLIAQIQNNTNKIQSIIHSSDILIISIGNIDIETEKNKTITQELNKLFSILRRLNNKEIIYISPNTFKNLTIQKELCFKYNIKFYSMYLLKNNKEELASILIKDITRTWHQITT